MELSNDVTSGLSSLADIKQFNAGQFNLMVEGTVDVLLNNGSASKTFSAQSLAKVDQRVLKHVHSSLATLFLEAAKQNYDEELFVSLVSEQGFGPKQTELLKKTFEEKREQLRALLMKSSFHFPHIIDVKWRLDYHIKSARIEKVDEPVWIINLKTIDKDGEPKDVEFSCNREEMQEFLAKLKDALNTVERITQAE